MAKFMINNIVLNTFSNDYSFAPADSFVLFFFLKGTRKVERRLGPATVYLQGATECNSIVEKSRCKPQRM